MINTSKSKFSIEKLKILSKFFLLKITQSSLKLFRAVTHLEYGCQKTLNPEKTWFLYLRLKNLDFKKLRKKSLALNKKL